MNSTTSEPRALVRRSSADDIDVVIRLFRRTAGHAWPFLDPDVLEAGLFRFRDAGFGRSVVWVAERGGGIVGFCAMRTGWIDHFYVAPEHQGRGVGQLLIGRALKGRRRVRLWTFQRNTRSRLFYALQGFSEARRTDGAANGGGEPDILMEWRRPVTG